MMLQCCVSAPARVVDLKTVLMDIIALQAHHAVTEVPFSVGRHGGRQLQVALYHVEMAQVLIVQVDIYVLVTRHAPRASRFTVAPLLRKRPPDARVPVQVEKTLNVPGWRLATSTRRAMTRSQIQIANLMCCPTLETHIIVGRISSTQQLGAISLAPQEVRQNVQWVKHVMKIPRVAEETLFIVALHGMMHQVNANNLVHLG